tara:strand:- start:4988 stop:5251 length:264 start_codon:yes stop_codon:yes gene_type:complete
LNKQILQIKLTPKAAKNAILGWESDQNDNPYLKCSVTAVPENGKANAALIKMLAKHLKISKSSITITGGHTSRLKKVEISGISELCL